MATSPGSLFQGGSIVKILLVVWWFTSHVNALLSATETQTQLILANDRFFAAVDKSTGAVQQMSLDGQDLLGPTSGSRGIGPYLDCYCIPSGFYTPGSIAPKYKLIKGTDSTNTAYGGIVMSEVYPATGQLMEQYWFLRDGETGLHVFSRLAYHNKAKPFLRNLQEMRTLLRPNTPLWTHLISTKDQYAPLPGAAAIAKQVTVQDATWYLGNTPNDPYVRQQSDYFTKYTFSETWRDQDVHGLYADGSTSKGNLTYGSWLVMNTKDTYFGGPTHSDILVDGIVYNYIVSNHHGDGTPNITDGFDRTFGPQYYYFNKGSRTTSMEELRQDARKYYSPTWNTAFYDSIARYIPNYVPSSGRSTWKGKITLPKGAKKPLAILSQNGVDYQDNVLDTTAYQYWADIDPTSGDVSIPAVKAGQYRLTVYADDIFGQFTQDNIKVEAGKVTTTTASWSEENAGTEVWRIGTPDKSSGEYKHGYELEPSKPLHPAQYRNYWAVHDFPNDFPKGVTFEIGKSTEVKDFNYVHWSVFGGYANSIRTVPHWENVNNWTVLWNMKKEEFNTKTKATLTVQLAGAKTAAGNTDVYNATQPYANLPYTVFVNGKKLEAWIIPQVLPMPTMELKHANTGNRYYHSSSCAVRSAVICYNIGHKFSFDPKVLIDGKNEIVLSLPPNATDYESAVLPRTIYVQYDALRLEVG